MNEVSLHTAATPVLQRVSSAENRRTLLPLSKFTALLSEYCFAEAAFGYKSLFKQFFL